MCYCCAGKDGGWSAKSAGGDGNSADSGGKFACFGGKFAFFGGKFACFGGDFYTRCLNSACASKTTLGSVVFLVFLCLKSGPLLGMPGSS